MTLNDVAVPDEIDRARLVEEAGDRVAALRVVLAQELERHVAADLDVLGAVDAAHAAAADDLGQSVRPEHLADARLGRHEVRPAAGIRRQQRREVVALQLRGLRHATAGGRHARCARPWRAGSRHRRAGHHCARWDAPVGGPVLSGELVELLGADRRQGGAGVVGLVVVVVDAGVERRLERPHRVGRQLDGCGGLAAWRARVERRAVNRAHVHLVGVRALTKMTRAHHSLFGRRPPADEPSILSTLRPAHESST